MMRRLSVAAFLLYPQIASGEPASCRPQIGLFQPSGGVVASAETAKTVAMAYLKPIYGSQQILRERPFKATLNNGVWFVEGFLPPGWHGGVAEIKICQRNGAVLSIIHGK